MCEHLIWVSVHLWLRVALGLTKHERHNMQSHVHSSTGIVVAIPAAGFSLGCLKASS